MARPTGVVQVAITIVAMLVGPALAAPPAPSGSQRFSGWTATCDNLGACVAIATAETDLFYLRIARDAGATAAPEVKMVLASPRALTGGSPAFRLQTMNESRATALGSFPARPVADIVDAYEATLEAGTPSLAALAALQDAATLDYAILDAKGTLGLKGLAAALRWIDVRQGRLGTPTALTARGMTPIGQVSPPRQPPVVHRAAPGTVTRIETPTASHDLLRRVRALEDCDAAVVAAHKDLEAWRLGPDLVLVAVPCVEGAYNLTSALYFTDARGGLPRPVPLPQPRVDDVATAENVVTNMRFDATTLELSDDAKGRGIGDCGETRTFVWTGEIFALVSATGLDACPGALPRDWPRLYEAEIR